MQQATRIAAAIKVARNAKAALRHTLDACRPVGPAVEPSPKSCPRSSGGRFARSLAAALCRYRSLANYEYSSIGRYAVIGCKLQVAILC